MYCAKIQYLTQRLLVVIQYFINEHSYGMRAAVIQYYINPSKYTTRLMYIHMGMREIVIQYSINVRTPEKRKR